VDEIGHHTVGSHVPLSEFDEILQHLCHILCGQVIDLNKSSNFETLQPFPKLFIQENNEFELNEEPIPTCDLELKDKYEEQRVVLGPLDRKNVILFGLNEECPDLVAHTEGVYCGLLSEVLCTRNSNSKPSHDIEFQDINESIFSSCIIELQLHEDNDKEAIFNSLEIKYELPFDHDEISFSDIHHTHKFAFSFEYIHEHIRSGVVIEDVKHEQMSLVHF
jgi:hypothetical protein